MERMLDCFDEITLIDVCRLLEDDDDVGGDAESGCESKKNASI